MNLKNILRAQGVMRWHILPCSKTQSLAEHQYNVCMIARQLCKVLGYQAYEVECMKLALEHDLDEIEFGDIPTPAKTKGRKDVPYRGKTRKRLVQNIVKIADMMDAVYFLYQYKLGPHGEQVYLQLFGDMGDKIESYGEKFLQDKMWSVWIELTDGEYV